LSRAADAPHTAELGDGLTGRVREGNGETVLWLHGYTMDSSIWTELWQHLPGWSHVGIDLPGHGGSRPIRAGEGLRQLARELGTLALDHGVRHLVGLSFGTTIALQVAIEQPRSFASLVLGAPAVGGGPQDDLIARRYIELALAFRTFGPGAELTSIWMRSPPDIFRGAEARPELWARLSAVIAKHRWSELVDRSIEPIAAHRQETAELGRIEAATLVLIGENDLEMSRASAELLIHSLRSCELVELPALGHLCLIEAPKQVAQVIDRHLGKNAKVVAQT
jgi:pimeloyl-ACP methyl ester carboxylesterase